MKRPDHRPSIVRRALAERRDLAEALAKAENVTRWIRIGRALGYGNLDTASMGTLIGKWQRSLQVAEVFAVTREMGAVVAVAGADLPEDYVVEHHHLYADHGLLYVEEPLSDQLNPEPIHMLTWHHGTGTTSRLVYGQSVLTAGVEINLWARDRHGMPFPIGSDFLPYGLPPAGWNPDTITDPLALLALQRQGNLSQVARFVLALQMLMRQELPSIGHHQMPRAEVRSMRRLGLPVTPCAVVDLRRRVYPQRDHEEVEGRRRMTVRTVVRGHWARYWVGPSHAEHPGGTEEKVAIYLYRAPHIRGPEGAPLHVVQDRVHVVRR